MPLNVEDGTGKPDANSYVTVEDADAYHSAHLNEGWFVEEPSKKEAALIRATGFIDTTYRARFPGYPSRGRAQALEWPRLNAFVERAGQRVEWSGYPTGYGPDGRTSPIVDLIPSSEIPREIRAAVCEAAIRELAKPGSLAPDLKRGGAIKSAGAGSARVEFFGNAPARTTFQAIDLALGALLLPTSPYSGRAVRG